MNNLRQFCSLAVLLLMLFAVCPLTAAAPATDAGLSLQQLQQENDLLKRQLRRMESQVAAQRQELSRPGATQVFGGIGYIVGIFGLAAWWSARRKSSQEKR